MAVGLRYGPFQVKIANVHFSILFLVLASQKKAFWHLKNDLFTFIKKLESHFGNLLWHGKPHVCAQYRHVIRKYDMDIAMNFVTWLESMNLHRW